MLRNVRLRAQAFQSRLAICSITWSLAAFAIFSDNSRFVRYSFAKYRMKEMQ
jgi:hypothetical protein